MHGCKLWKLPLPEYLESLYQKRFGRTTPEDPRSIEAKVAAKRAKKAERKKPS